MQHRQKFMYRKAWAALAVAALAVSAQPASAQEPKGEIVVIDWTAGGLHRMQRELEAAYMRLHPGVKFREIAVNGQGDSRAAIRAALQGGAKADLLFNVWPAFRAELAKSGQLRALDDVWVSQKWNTLVANKWRVLGQVNGVTFGLNYTYGDRSGIFYRKSVLQKAGISAPPKTWTEFLASFKPLRAAGIVPVAVPGKVWAHAEWFESLLLRTGGVEVSSKLAVHKIAWTDPVVKNALKKYAEMLRAECCDPPAKMLATDWDNAADNVLKEGTHAYNLIGMWVNERAKNDYQLAESSYALFQFPSMGSGFDDTSSIDSRELLALNSGSNSAAADAFLGWMLSPEAATIVARSGMPSTSSKVQTSLYGPVIATSAKAVASSKLQSVLGDLLPGDLVDEYRIQLQKFLQDPSDANIDKVLTAIEAKAATAYK